MFWWKNKKHLKGKKKAFQYIGKNDEDKGKEISLISKEASFISFVFRE